VIYRPGVRHAAGLLKNAVVAKGLLLLPATEMDIR